MKTPMIGKTRISFAALFLVLLSFFVVAAGVQSFFPADSLYVLDGNLSKTTEDFQCLYIADANLTSNASVQLWTNYSNVWERNVSENVATRRVQVTNITINTTTGAYVTLNLSVFNNTIVVRNATQGIVNSLGNWSMDSTQSGNGQLNITNESYFGKVLNVSYWYDSQINLVNVTFGVDNFLAEKQNDGFRMAWSCRVEMNVTTGTNSTFSTNRTLYVELPPNNVSILSPQQYTNHSTDIPFNITIASPYIGGNGIVEDSDNLTDCDFYTNETGTWLFKERIVNIYNGTTLNFTRRIVENRSIAAGLKCWERALPQVYNWSQNVSFTVDYTVPSVTLITPTNASTINGTKPVNITYSVTDANVIRSCVLYSNSTNAWVANVTNSTITSNGAAVNVENLLNTLPEGQVVFGLACADYAGNNVTDTNGVNRTINFTLTVDRSAPLIRNVSNISQSSQNASGWEIRFNTSKAANSTVYWGWNTTFGFVNRSSAFVTDHIIALPLREGTINYYNISVCDQNGNCNNSLIGGVTTSFNVTPTKIYAGWNAYMNFEPDIDMGAIANSSNADFVYKWNHTAQSWQAHTRGGSANAETSVFYGEVFWIFRATSFNYQRNITAKEDPPNFLFNLTTGINFVGLQKNYTFWNTSGSGQPGLFRNASGGFKVSINATAPGYLGSDSSDSTNIDISLRKIDFFSFWVNSEQKYKSYYRNSTFNNLTNLTFGHALMVGTSLNVTWNGTAIVGNWTNS